MSNRIVRSALLIPSVLSLAVAGVIAVAVYLSGPAAVLHDTASVTRMPIPGTTDVNLPAGEFGLYLGNLNTATGKMMSVPQLEITVVPPQGQPDPDFVTVPPKPDVYVDGYHTVQVASIKVTAPGPYHVHVESHEQNGGSFSIGMPPASVTAGHNVLRASPFIAFFAVLGLGLGIASLRRGKTK